MHQIASMAVIMGSFVIFEVGVLTYFIQVMGYNLAETPANYSHPNYHPPTSHQQHQQQHQRQPLLVHTKQINRYDNT